MEVPPSPPSPSPIVCGVEPPVVRSELPQVASSDDILGSSSYSGMQSDASTVELLGSNYCDDASDEDLYYEEDEEFEFDESIEYDYENDLSAKFDKLQIPSGIEVDLSCLQQQSSPELPIKEHPENSCEIDRKFKSFKLQIPSGIEVDLSRLQQQSSPELPIKEHPENSCEVDRKFKSFKQFDIVENFSDHHFSSANVYKPTKDWIKRIQNEWKLLENDLPEAIFVRVYGERMDLLRAVIVGAAGTPYHDGLFFFDAQFPRNYPQSPPAVHYHSGGLRLNPNLYINGMVCLSLLGTWSGSGCERWDPSKSTMLQVLISIQALILNEKPYFNEPGHELSAHTDYGEMQALLYNEDTFILSCKTMLYSLRRSPKHFEDFVAEHFCQRGQAILAACEAYLHGAKVGSNISNDEVPDDGKVTPFKGKLQALFDSLLMEFTVKGADCDKFLEQKKGKHLESTSKGNIMRLG